MFLFVYSFIRLFIYVLCIIPGKKVKEAVQLCLRRELMLTRILDCISLMYSSSSRCEMCPAVLDESSQLRDAVMSGAVSNRLASLCHLYDTKQPKTALPFFGSAASTKHLDVAPETYQKLYSFR